jgi:Tol biopolymer transport system component
VVKAGSGADWIVGNRAVSALDLVSRAGSIGSPSGTGHASVSADGRFVAFESGWTGLGSDDSDRSDVFVKDMVGGTISNEHKSADGTHGGSGSGAPMVSADGSVLTFLSASYRLVPGPRSGSLYDIYASDVQGNGIIRVNTGSGGELAEDGRSLNPDLSADGRYVVFESGTSSWALGGAQSATDIYVKDLQTGGLIRVSTSLTGGAGNDESRDARISDPAASWPSRATQAT